MTVNYKPPKRELVLTGDHSLAITRYGLVKRGLDLIQKQKLLCPDIKVYQNNIIHDVLGTLTPRERRILQLRFGLVDGITRTLEEVGKEFGVIPETIRQIEERALRKLRHPSRSRKLKALLGSKHFDTGHKDFFKAIFG